jgi:hypothetical protein
MEPLARNFPAKAPRTPTLELQEEYPEIATSSPGPCLFSSPFLGALGALAFINPRRQLQDRRLRPVVFARGLSTRLVEDKLNAKAPRTPRKREEKRQRGSQGVGAKTLAFIYCTHIE